MYSNHLNTELMVHFCPIFKVQNSNALTIWQPNSLSGLQMVPLA
jgi:hypothetical protein